MRLETIWPSSLGIHIRKNEHCACAAPPSAFIYLFYVDEVKKKRTLAEERKIIIKTHPSFSLVYTSRKNKQTNKSDCCSVKVESDEIGGQKDIKGT